MLRMPSYRGCEDDERALRQPKWGEDQLAVARHHGSLHLGLAELTYMLPRASAAARADLARQAAAKFSQSLKGASVDPA